eukprot:scaffold8001_cov125-Isochrysis_galbana.AAC.7
MDRIRSAATVSIKCVGVATFARQLVQGDAMVQGPHLCRHPSECVCRVCAAAPHYTWASGLAGHGTGSPVSIFGLFGARVRPGRGPPARVGRHQRTCHVAASFF